MKIKKSGITASDLKYIAIIAMLIDHIASSFVPRDITLYYFMRFIGRITAPVMCFFISEGYHYTKNLKKYFQRMAIFAIISYFPFTFRYSGTFFRLGKGSMITTLFFSLLAVHIVNTDKIKKEFILPAIIVICKLTDFSDWGSEAVIYTLAFELARSNRKNQVIAYGLTASAFRLFPLIVTTMKDLSYFSTYWVNLGVFIPIPLLLLYNGEKGGGKYTKWVFYIFYPAHLLILGVIKYYVIS